MIWATSATIYTVSSQLTNFQVKVPFVSELVVGEPDLQVEAANFYFDVQINRYTNATFEVRNSDYSSSHSGIVYVVLYSSTNMEIATGECATGNVPAGTAVSNVFMSLTWYGSYTITDFARGKITLVQNS